MDADAPLPHWNELAAIDDHALPLLGVALLIARDEYPHLDPRQYEAQVRAHAAQVREAIDGDAHRTQKMRAINRHLFEEVGYAGNHDEYYDPRNSYLNEVLDRRLGNPISLALVQMEVARRVGLPLDGISFPGHFLVRLPVDDGMLVMDPFNRGRPLDGGGCDLGGEQLRCLGDEFDVGPARHHPQIDGRHEADRGLAAQMRIEGIGIRFQLFDGDLLCQGHERPPRHGENE